MSWHRKKENIIQREWAQWYWQAAFRRWISDENANNAEQSIKRLFRNYRNDARAWAMPISQWTPILSANFRMLDWLPATSLNLLPKFETVSIHASDFAPMRTRIGSNSGLMKPRLPSRIILPDWSTRSKYWVSGIVRIPRRCEFDAIGQSHVSEERKRQFFHTFKPRL